ncbi:MAG: ATP-binding protein [Leptospiraceae bacterium]|jgi:DNA replication protein DnaC|nr:ATP-binding protein [Leptospiraceae bacterium]MCZ8346748.1 ATP-binding protein [Leptospiraceae bacterium]PJD99797.1 MAG: DNA replication protein DnaC [Leptospira sp.]
MNLADVFPFRHGVVDCPYCGGAGIILDTNVRGLRSGALSVCHCVGSDCNVCPSKGEPPFLVYDIDSDMQIPCMCHGARLELIKLEKLVAKAGIPPRYRFQFLQSIDIGDKSNDPELSFLIAHDWASELVHKWKDPNFNAKGFYLWGGTGSGKTLLACVILNELIFRYGVNCKYAKVNKDFLSAILNTYQKDSETSGQESNIEKEFANVDVLVIDDFGIQKDSEFNNRKLYDLIDTRYENEKLTLLTSNQALEDWKIKGEGRIYSRLMEMTKEIQLKCPDYRLKGVQN